MWDSSAQMPVDPIARKGSHLRIVGAVSIGLTSSCSKAPGIDSDMTKQYFLLEMNFLL